MILASYFRSYNLSNIMTGTSLMHELRHNVRKLAACLNITPTHRLPVIMITIYLLECHCYGEKLGWPWLIWQQLYNCNNNDIMWRWAHLHLTLWITITSFSSLHDWHLYSATSLCPTAIVKWTMITPIHDCVNFVSRLDRMRDRHIWKAYVLDT